MNRFYNTGFIPARETHDRVKQGLQQQEVANVCSPFGTTCNQKSLYPIQQVLMEVPALPEGCNCSNYIISP